MYYINCAFRDLQYDDTMFAGRFESLELDKAVCCFSYNRLTGETEIWDSNTPAEQILPLPIHWLEYQLKKKGHLDSNEVKISY